MQLYNNKVELVQGLKRCAALHTVNLANNRVVSMRGLEEELPRAVRWLSLASNRLVAMEGLAHLTGLVHVDLSYNELTSVTGLSTLTGLEELKLKCVGAPRVGTVMLYCTPAALIISLSTALVCIVLFVPRPV